MIITQMTIQQTIAALSQDLYRAATGFNRGSTAMATVFTKEAKKKIDELQKNNTNQYINKLISQTVPLLFEHNDKTAEHLLMYSILFKNYAHHLS